MSNNDSPHMDAVTQDYTVGTEDKIQSSAPDFMEYFQQTCDDIPPLTKKRPQSVSNDESLVSSSAKKPVKKKSVVESMFGPTGISKSAKSS